MQVIIPAILPASREDLEQTLARFDGLVESVQIDIVDGRFAAPASWPYTGGAAEFEELTARGGTFPHFEQFRFETDLMIEDPEKSLGAWVSAGATRILVHAESTEKLSELITRFESTYGHDKDFAPELLSLGVAFNIGTDPESVAACFDKVDYVQFMGIDRIGVQGQPFNDAVLKRIIAFRRAHPNVPVQVDGGVTLETAPALLSAGVARLVVGSALLRAPDLGAELDKFNTLTEQYGLFRS